MDKVCLSFICFLSLLISCHKEESLAYNEYTTSINIKDNQIIEFESIFKFNKPVKNIVYFLVDEKMFDLKINGKSDFQYTIDSKTNEIKIKLESTKYNLKKLHFTYKIALDQLEHKSPSGLLLMDKELVPQLFNEKQIQYFSYQINFKNISPYKFFFTNKSITDNKLTDRPLAILSNDEFSKYIVNNVSIFHTKASQDKLTFIADETQKIRKIYNYYLQIEPKEEIKILLNDYYNYSFYSRDDFISLQNISYEKGIMYLLSHEIAHSWFSTAEIYNYSSDAFMNESFAEYMTYIYYRTLYGESQFKELVQRKKKEANNTGYSLVQVNRNMDGDILEKILYTKGALICYELERKIGRNNFKHLLQLTIKNQTSTLEEFEELLGGQYGEEVKNLFQDLKNRKSFSMK